MNEGVKYSQTFVDVIVVEQFSFEDVVFCLGNILRVCSINWSRFQIFNSFTLKLKYIDFVQNSCKIYVVIKDVLLISISHFFLCPGILRCHVIAEERGYIGYLYRAVSLDSII